MKADPDALALALHHVFEGWVCHLPADDPDWRKYADEVLAHLREQPVTENGKAPLKDCEQQCGRPATVYAVDPHIAGGWGGYYCDSCVQGLCFQIVDRLPEKTR
jgi:hypothetical protein